MFEHDRSFRRDHAPHYKDSKLGVELVAELFNKYCMLSTRYDPDKADRFLTRNYGGAWQSLKHDIIPDLAQDIAQFDAQKLDKKTKPVPKAKLNADRPHMEQNALRHLRNRFGEANIKGVRYNENGDLDIKAPKSFSRSNLERVGIKNASGLRRKHFDDQHAVITIPKSALPLTLKFDQAGTSAKRSLPSPTHSVQKKPLFNFQGQRAHLA